MRKLSSVFARIARRPAAADIQLLRDSPLMDADWYRSNYSDLRNMKEDPVFHYLKVGAAERRNPSSHFDTDFYLSTYPDIVVKRVNPLVHYLRQGVGEGRRALADQIVVRPLEQMPIVCVKPIELRERMALVSTYAPTGRPPARVTYLLDRLSALGISPILVVSTDAPLTYAAGDFPPSLGGVYVRGNEGQDFPAWVHVMRLNPALLDLESLFLVSDRFVGPISDEMLKDVVARIDSSEAAVFGLTDSYAVEWHLEPDFLVLKKAALRSPAFRDYVSNLKSLHDRDLSLAEHVVPLMRTFTQQSLGVEALFPSRSGDVSDRTVRNWRELISQGFPFLNVAVVEEAREGADSIDWRMMVSAYGFDPALIDADFEAQPAKSRRAALMPLGSSAERIQTARSLRKGETSFSPEFYLHLYSDVGRAGVDPLTHFILHGRAEGRLGSLPGVESLSELDPTRETVLVVSHDGTFTGCPVLSFNICRHLSKRFNVIALFLGAGPMIASYRAAGIVTIGPIMVSSSPDFLENVVSFIGSSVALKFAIVNSVEARFILPALATQYIASVSLIHEFAAYTRSPTAFRDAARWAGETVFSTRITHDDAIRAWPALSIRDYPIVAQGRCLPVPAPADSGASTAPGKSAAAERARVRAVLRPPSSPSDTTLVIGIGTVQMRKGVDLFLNCAAKIRSIAPERAWRFVWAGHGYNPKADFEYSAYLADQVLREGLSEHFEFLGETHEVLEVYAEADLLLLTSRLDPLPNVAIEAMESGVPVFCFDKTTGIADILVSEGLGDTLVAGYLDVDRMARQVADVVEVQGRLAELSERVRSVAQCTFDMERYVLRLEELAQGAVIGAAQEQVDVDTIMDNLSIVRSDYFIPPGRQDKRMKSLIREYVRAWASELDMRKMIPGFHPGVFRERAGTSGRPDPLAEYLRLGRPEGPWSYPVITPTRRFTPPNRAVRVGLHIHAHYPDLLPEILARLKRNKTRMEILVSITSAEHEASVERLLRHHGEPFDLRVTPNRGRDIGSMLTEFGGALHSRFDLIGHLHTKKTADIEDEAVGRSWFRFLLENLVGGRTPMADIILGRMAQEPKIGLVFADDPHVLTWGANAQFVEPYLERLALGPLPRHMHVPVGTMFWARPQALAKMFELQLGWEDYPPEPLPFDGSLLHGLERLFGLVAESAGFGVAGANSPGLTR